jgi:hypothetical protein
MISCASPKRFRRLEPSSATLLVVIEVEMVENGRLGAEITDYRAK